MCRRVFVAIGQKWFLINPCSVGENHFFTHFNALVAEAITNCATTKAKREATKQTISFDNVTGLLHLTNSMYSMAFNVRMFYTDLQFDSAFGVYVDYYFGIYFSNSLCD